MGFRNYTADDFKDALRQSSGIIAGAARILDCSRTTVHKAVNEFETVREVLEDERASTVDEAERRLVKAMRSDAPWAIKMILRTQGGDRFTPTRKQEISGPSGGPVEIVFDGEIPDPDGD